RVTCTHAGDERERLVRSSSGMARRDETGSGLLRVSRSQAGDQIEQRVRSSIGVAHRNDMGSGLLPVSDSVLVHWLERPLLLIRGILGLENYPSASKLGGHVHSGIRRCVLAIRRLTVVGLAAVLFCACSPSTFLARKMTVAPNRAPQFVKPKGRVLLRWPAEILERFSSGTNEVG